MKTTWICVLALMLCLGAGALAQEKKPASKSYVLKAARLFDGKSNALVRPGVVVVTDGKIVAVGGNVTIPAGAEIVDLGDATLLPGFIDAHTHLSHPYIPDFRQRVVDGQRKTIAEQALDATEDLRKTLMAGFTTCRDVGSNDFIDIGLRNAVASGKIAGPRMLVAVKSIGATGGHCDPGGGVRYGLRKESGIEQGVINSADEARAAVRFNLKYGADVIKTCA